MLCFGALIAPLSLGYTVGWQQSHSYPLAMPLLEAEFDLFLSSITAQWLQLLWLVLQRNMEQNGKKWIKINSCKCGVTCEGAQKKPTTLRHLAGLSSHILEGSLRASFSIPGDLLVQRRSLLSEQNQYLTTQLHSFDRTNFSK